MYNLEVPAVCTGEVFGEDGLSFTDIDESKIFCKQKILNSRQ